MLFSGSLTAKPSLGEKRCWCKSSSESLIPSSSMAEHDAVNVGVSGSSPLLGAKQSVAQSSSALPLEGRGRGSEAHHSDLKRKEASASGSLISSRWVGQNHLPLSAVIV